MVTQKDLQALVDFRGEGQVLSLYLDTDLSQQQKEQCRLVLREKLYGVADKSLADDVARIEQYFDYEYDWQAKGVAIYSQQPNLWQAFSLTVPITTHVFVADQPYIKPLTDLLEEYKAYAVALVDSEGARLFVVEQGEISEADEVIGEIVKRHKQGGWSAASHQRRADMQVLHNLKLAAEATSELCRRQACQGLVLAGGDENVARFRDLLPKGLQHRIIGTVPADMTASGAEILSKSADVVWAAKREEENALVSQMVTNAAKRELGVTGLLDTLYAIGQGQVHMLLVEKGYEAPGALCANCGNLSAAVHDNCRFCRSETHAVDNAVDLAVQKTIEAGGQVKVIEGNVELARNGRIGAILRY